MLLDLLERDGFFGANRCAGLTPDALGGIQDRHRHLLAINLLKLEHTVRANIHTLTTPGAQFVVHIDQIHLLSASI
jgi:hypothetical protein